MNASGSDRGCFKVNVVRRQGRSLASFNGGLWRIGDMRATGHVWRRAAGWAPHPFAAAESGAIAATDGANVGELALWLQPGAMLASFRIGARTWRMHSPAAASRRAQFFWRWKPSAKVSSTNARRRCSRGWAAPGPGTDRCYAGRTTTFVLTGVREYRCIMSWLSRPTQPLVMPFPIDSGSLEA